MKARLLEQSEWGKLDRTELPVLLAQMRPENVSVAVVEDEGKVVASLAVLRVTHLEGLWIDPAYRNGGVGRALLRAMLPVARCWGGAWAFGAAASDAMRGLLARLGAVRVPVDFFAVSLAGEVVGHHPSPDGIAAREGVATAQADAVCAGSEV